MSRPEKSKEPALSRRSFLMLPMAALASAVSGCGHGLMFWRRPCEEEVFTAPAEVAPYVGPRMRLVVVVRADGVPPEFAFPVQDYIRTLSVALQETGRFEVVDVLDPRETPELLLVPPDGPCPPVGAWPGGVPPCGPVDARLMIDVVEFRPYRPMQMHTRVRLVDPRGQEIAGFDRTWYGPKDVEPIRRLHPRALRYPPPPAREEAAVTTNSPQHLLDVASRESAGILAMTVPPPAVPEMPAMPPDSPGVIEPPALEMPPVNTPASEYPLPAPPAWESPVGTQNS